MIRLYSFHAVPPPLLGHQRDMFAGFMAEEDETVVANDGQDEADAAAISQAAATLGPRCEAIPLPERDNPSDGLATPMDFVLAALLGDDEEISVLHEDVVPGGAFSLRAVIGDADITAVPEGKSSTEGARTIHYPWSGFIFLRTPCLPDRETLGFGAGWHPDDVRNQRATQEWFTALCDGLLTSGLTLQQTSAPAVAPWRADTP